MGQRINQDKPADGIYHPSFVQHERVKPELLCLPQLAQSTVSEDVH